DPPKGFINAVDSLYSTTDLGYSVFTNDGNLIPLTWDNGSNSFLPGIPPNPNFNVLMQQLVSTNESFLIPSLMRTYGVKYVFFDKTQILFDSALYNALETSGLSVAYSTQNYTVFSLDSSSEIVLSPISISLSNFSQLDDIEALNLLYGANLFPAIVSSNASLDLTDTSDGLEKGKGIFYPTSELASEFPSFIERGLPGDYSGSTNADNFPIGDNLNITKFNGLYYINYSIINGTLTIAKFNNNTGNSPNSAINVYFKNGQIAIPPDASVLINYSFDYSLSPGQGSVSFYAYCGNYQANLANTRQMITGTADRRMTGSFTIPQGQSWFQLGWVLSKYNGTLTLSNLNISYTFLKNGMVYVPNLQRVLNATPGDSYKIIYAGENKSFVPSLYIKNVRSQQNGTIDLNLSGIQYLNSIAIVPYRYLSGNTSPSFVYWFFRDGLGFNGYAGTNNSFLIVSFNPDYIWSTSKNVHPRGTNSLGQQIFEIKPGGLFSLSIKDSFQFAILDWSTAVFENLILPMFLFIPAVTATFVRLRKFISIGKTGGQ
ncbi:MAG: hypothetical protein QXU18_01785, partial [Thermoplasmatales archaeon]